MRLRRVSLLFCVYSSLAVASSGSLAFAQQTDQNSGTSETSAAPAEKLDLTPDANGRLSQEQMRALIRVVTQNYRDNYKKLRDYTYVDREVERKLDGQGDVKSTEVRTYEIMELYGEPVSRLIEKDDKPLNDKDRAKEDERIQKISDRRKNESEEERKKREAEREKAREKSREFLSEVADAYSFTLEASETLNGRDCWVIRGERLPDFHPKSKDAQMLSKIRGKLWIDKAELQLAKMDVDVMDTISFGWVLARIYKGTRFDYEQVRVNDEVWLPQHVAANVDVRVALVKSDKEEDEETYSDYKKFHTAARIVGFGEVKDQK
jgi:hypothetical protein